MEFDVTVKTTYRVQADNIADAVAIAEEVASGDRGSCEAVYQHNYETTGVTKL